MQNLYILTNNNLGINFWEQRTCLINAVQIRELNIEALENLINAGAEFILIDFYFSHFSMEEEHEMIQTIRRITEKSSVFLKLFILSSSYSDSTIENDLSGNRLIVAHNFSVYFLKTLLKTVQKLVINNENKAS